MTAPGKLPPPSPELTGLGVAMRAVRADDAHFLNGLYRGLRMPELALLDWPVEAKMRLLDDQFRLQSAHFTTHHPRADFLIVTRSAPPLAGADIGRLYVERTLGRWHLLEITIDGAHRNAGIGAALLRWLQHSAGAAGAALSLQVARDNRCAEELYRRLGFVEAPIDSASHRQLVWRVS